MITVKRDVLGARKEGTLKAPLPADGPTNICSGTEMRPGATPNNSISTGVDDSDPITANESDSSPGPQATDPDKESQPVQDS